MSDNSQKLVTVYDWDTKQKTSVPQSELAPGMMRAIIQGEEGEVWIDSGKIPANAVDGDFRHPPFTGELKKAIGFIEETFREVWPRQPNEWEDGFRKDAHPEREIAMWFHAATCFNEFVETYQVEASGREEAFQVLCACLNSSRETVFDILPAGLKERPLVRKLVEAYFTAPGAEKE